MSYIGNGLLRGQEVVGLMELGDDKMPCLRLSYVPGPVPGDDQTSYETNATVQIDADGSDSKLEIVVTKERYNFGTATTDRTYTISVGSAKVAWANSDANTYTATASKMYDIIDLLNEIPNIHANILHAPWNMDVNSDNFIDLAETDIPSRGSCGGTPLDCLYRDADAFMVETDHLVTYMRIGLPEAWDMAPMEIVNVKGIVADGQETGGIVRLYKDNRADIGDDPKPLILSAIGDDDTQTDYLDREPGRGISTAGSLLLEVNSSTLSTPKFWVTRIAM